MTNPAKPKDFETVARTYATLRPKHFEWTSLDASHAVVEMAQAFVIALDALKQMTQGPLSIDYDPLKDEPHCAQMASKALLQIRGEL